MKKIVELINPSDPVTFEMQDVKVAGVAVLLLGRGAYGLKTADGNDVVPLMLFDGGERWLKKQRIADLDKYLRNRGKNVAAFLDTCAYGSIADREGFDAAIKRMTKEKAAEHRAWWNDKHRGSLNDIGNAAAGLAVRLREIAAGKKSDKPLPKATPIIAVSRS